MFGNFPGRPFVNWYRIMLITLLFFGGYNRERHGERIWCFPGYRRDVGEKLKGVSCPWRVLRFHERLPLFLTSAPFCEFLRLGRHLVEN